MLFFQLLELPGFSPLIMALLIVVIRRNYFNRPNLKFFGFELFAGVGIAASILSIYQTTQFNTNIFALKIANNPAGWYAFTFIELFAVIGYAIYKQKSLVLAVMVAFADVGLHELIWWLGQGVNIVNYLNLNEFFWAGIVFPVPFAALLIFKVNYKLYFLPMIAYLILGLAIPWFFDPSHNDIIGWTLCSITTSLALSPRKFGDAKKEESPGTASRPLPEAAIQTPVPSDPAPEEA